jgi:hypothetical protein
MRSNFAFLLLASTLAACGGDAPPERPGGGDTSDPVALVCDLVEAACERQIACGYHVLNGESEVDACIEAQRCQALAGVVASKEAVIDVAAVKACAAAIEGASCGELAAQGVGIDPACEHYVTGTRGEGESCRGGTISDCAAGLACDLSAGTCPGTCRAPAARCTEGSCGPDAFCTSAGACQPRAAIGEACDETLIDFDNLSDDACATGAHCDGGLCKADLGAGEACAGTSIGACGPGAACACTDPASCGEPDLACLPAHAAGEPCSSAFDCAEGLHCDFDGGGRCAPRAGLGEACGASLGACLHTLVCVEGHCVAEAPAVTDIPLLDKDGSCDDGGACPLGTTCTCDDASCQVRFCRAAPALGESCEARLLADYTPFACAEGLCDVLGALVCVRPGDAGAPCATEGLTLACASLVCQGGKCASIEETRCE